MDGRVDAWALWLRAVGVGSVAFLFGVVGHVSADGLLPSRWLLATLGVFCVLLGLPMLRQQASRLRLVLMVVGGQTAIHLALTVTAGHRGDRTPALGGSAGPAPSPVRDLPVVDGRRVGSMLDAYQGMSGHSTSAAPTLPIGHLLNDLAAHGPMMAAHLAAAVVVGLWLAYGERCLWDLVALTGRRILAAAWALVPVAAPVPVQAGRADRRDPLRPRSLWRHRPCTRRGPPALVH